MKKLAAFFAGGLMMAAGCSKVEVDSSIPECKVYFKTLGTNDYNYLKTVGAYKAFTAEGGAYPANTYLGFGGLLIFRDFNGTLRCVDLACPHCYQKEHCCYRIQANSSLRPQCPNCHSVYDLQWGVCAPTEGPSKEPLKIYTHCTDNGTAIRVTY